jgi:hypothetical protein
MQLRKPIGHTRLRQCLPEEVDSRAPASADRKAQSRTWNERQKHRLADHYNPPRSLRSRYRSSSVRKALFGTLIHWLTIARAQRSGPVSITTPQHQKTRKVCFKAMTPTLALPQFEPLLDTQKAAARNRHSCRDRRKALFTRTRYQNGSLRVKKRGNGLKVWEFRYYEPVPEGNRSCYGSTRSTRSGR